MFDVADAEAAAFRRDVAAWTLANFPPALAGKTAQRYATDGGRARSDADYQLWLRRVVERGWGAPTWPEEYGGGGLSPTEASIIRQEMARAGAFHPNLTYGATMLAPTLLELGDEAQKRRFLPPIARGEERWCQGFSEPGAGSDLASLQTKAVDDGDCWVVTGQKIWTSDANNADWCFALVRTDNSVKQAGISFLLIDMKSKGVEARPISLISGSTHFCEVFFNAVRVPKENMVGGVNRGWSVAKRLLQFERDSLANGRGDPPALVGLAKRHIGENAQGQIADAELRGRVLHNAMRARAYSMTLRRAVLEAKTPTAPAVSALKNLGSDIAQTRAEIVIDILGHAGLGWEGDAFAPADLEETRAWLHSKAFSIYGGSHEIQDNITSKRVLALPSMD